jgi:hypothetical protein
MHGAVIQFLCAESARPANIHSQMKHVYDDDCLQHIAMFGPQGSNRVGAALKTWDALVVNPTLETQTTM